MSEAGDVISGELYNIVDVNLMGDGAVGHIVNNAADVVNNVICTTLGPNFLQIFVNHHECSNGIFTPSIFHSWPNFCQYFNAAPPNIRKCLFSTAVEYKGRLMGISDGYIRVGKCCCTNEVSITYKEHF